LPVEDGRAKRSISVGRGTQEVDVDRLAVLAQRKRDRSAAPEVALRLLEERTVERAQQLRDALVMNELKH
jgi:hypothetical protein